MSSGGPGQCDACGETTWLLPLHGEKGGPLRCFKCAGEWNAVHGRRRKAGRVVIKALKFYEEAGGMSTDLDKLWLAASGLTIPGYGHARRGDRRVVELCHPDKHPAERKELANRVTQELLALKPFVFPAPRKPSRTPTTSEPDPLSQAFSKAPNTSLSFPCGDCAHTIPTDYCDGCRAERDKRWEKEAERERAKQREQYRARRERRIRSVWCTACKKLSRNAPTKSSAPMLVGKTNTASA